MHGCPIYSHCILHVLGTDAGDYDIMQTVIGQGKTQITPLQLNMITGAIANDGIAMKPYLIDRIENYNGSTVKKYEPEKYATLMTNEEAAFLTGLMEGVVENGTATRLRGLSYTAARKTGSAEYSPSLPAVKTVRYWQKRNYRISQSFSENPENRILIPMKSLISGMT